jgi:hypothetical protein
MSDVEQIPKVEGEIGELMRHDSASKSVRDGADNASEQSTEKLESLIRTVGEASTEEIDRVISQLEDVRAVLRRESERVTQEIKNYERLSETTMYATKNINDRLKQGKPEVDVRYWPLADMTVAPHMSAFGG